MSAGRELRRWWEVIGAAVIPEGINIAIWRGRLPRLEECEVHEAARRGWLGESDIRAVERRATPELAGRLAARRLLRRMIVATHAGCTPHEVRIEACCAQCGDTAHGLPKIVAPELALHRLSTAATHDFFLIGLAAMSIGVDVERRSRGADLSSLSVGLAVPGWVAVERACRPRSTVIDVWAAFEALTKSTGLGLTATPSTIVDALESRRLHWLQGEPDLVACVASADPQPAMAIVDVDLRPPDVSAA